MKLNILMKCSAKPFGTLYDLNSHYVLTTMSTGEKILYKPFTRSVIASVCCIMLISKKLDWLQ